MGNAHSSSIGKGLSDKDLLALSVQEGHSDSIPLFLKKTPSMFHMQFNNRNSLLHVAAQKGHHKALDAILKTAREGVLSGTTNSGDAISKLLNQQNKDGQTALVVSCIKGAAECVRCLVSYGADVWLADHNGRTALHHAALRGHSACARVLLEKYQTALQFAMEGDTTEAAHSHASPLTSPSSTSSRVAEHPGHKVLQQTAASRYANVKDNYGITPLHCAAWSGDVETAVALLRGGAFLVMQAREDCYDKEITCNAGHTPLHIAALKGTSDMVTIMLCDYVSNCRDGQMHVDPRAITDAYNRTPHQLAASRDHMEVAALLNPMTLIGDMVRPDSPSIDVYSDTQTTAAAANGSNHVPGMNGSHLPSLSTRKPRSSRGGPTISSLMSMSSDAADFISLLGSTGSSPAAAPDWFICPITGHVFTDPVVASDGFTYEREAITARLNSGNLLSPIHDQPLTSAHVYSNTVLYLAIKEWQLYIQRAAGNSLTVQPESPNLAGADVPTSQSDLPALEPAQAALEQSGPVQESDAVSQEPEPAAA